MAADHSGDISPGGGGRSPAPFCSNNAPDGAEESRGANAGAELGVASSETTRGDADNSEVIEISYEPDSLGKRGTVRYTGGDVYEGELKDGKRHGTGVYRYADGGVYDGEWQDGAQHGKGTATYETGIYNGNWKDGVKHGRGTQTWRASGAIYDGEWEENEMHGVGSYTWACGDVYEGERREGKMHGEGTLTYANGSVYEGQFEGGKEHGEGTLKYASGRVYEGQWAEGNEHGKGTLTYPSGEVYEGQWVEGKRHGKFTWKGSKGGLCEQVWANGRQTEGKRLRRKARGPAPAVSSVVNSIGLGLKDMGLQNAPTNSANPPAPASPPSRPATSASEMEARSNANLEDRDDDAIETIRGDNGDVYEGKVKHGARYGRGVCRYANGDVYDGEWKASKRHGRGTMTYASGTVYDGLWVEGKHSGWGTKTWPEGEVYDGEWKNNTQHGVGSYTWADGEVYEGQWVEGIQQGKGVYRYACGNVYDGEWKDGKHHGHGTRTWTDGAVHEGGWKDNIQYGWGKQTLPSGDVFEGEWVDGQLRGNNKEEGIVAKAKARSEGTAPGASDEKQPEKERRIYDHERTLRSAQSQERRMERNVTAEKCEHCGADDVQYKLRVCSGCNLALYCSPACQKAASRSHRRICDIISELPPRDSDGLVLKFDGEKQNDFDAGLRYATKYMPNLKHLEMNLTGVWAEEESTTKLSSEKMSSFLRSKRGVLESVLLVSCALYGDHWKEMQGLKQLHFENASFDGVQSLHAVIRQQKDTLIAFTLPFLGDCWAPASCRQSLTQALNSCKSLVKLDLQGCLLTDCDLKVLLRDLSNLRILDLRRNKCQTHEFTDKGCGIIARQCPNLQELNLDDHDRLSMKGIYQIFKGCAHLRYFLTTTRKLIRDDIRSLLDVAPQLVCLSLGRKHGITSPGLGEIIEETGGRTLLVGGCENNPHLIHVPLVNYSMLSEKAKENYDRQWDLMEEIHDKRKNRRVTNRWEELWKGVS